MKILLSIFVLALFHPLSTLAQSDSQPSANISIIDFVQIQNGNVEETMYYYQNNWKMLRDQALERGFISGYQLLEVEPDKDAPFHLMLITTFENQEQFDKVEDNFRILMENRGPRNLLNEKQPGDFRKILFSKTTTRQWN